MRMKKLWIFITILAIGCGIGAVLFQANLMPKQKVTISKFIQNIMPGKQKGLIRGIVSSEDSFTALIDTQAVREGDTIHGVKIVKIHVDKVEFEKDGRQWTQELNETPSRQWREGVKAMAKEEVKAKAEEDTKAQAETEAKAQAEVDVKALAEAKAKEEAEAASAQAEAKAKAEEEARAIAEAEAKAQAETEAKALAEAKARTETIQIDEATQKKLDELIKLLGDKEPSVRNSAVEALEQTGGPAVRPLINALEDEYWIIRQRSAETLGRISDPRAVEPLIAALEDDNMWVRLRSVEALGQLCDRRAVEPVNSILADKNELVRRRAAEVLGQLCDGRSVGPLIDALADKNELVRRHAAEALGLIGDKQATEALVKTLEDKNPDVRTVVAGALESIRSKAAMEEKATASNGKQANSIIETLIDLKIYVGAGIGILLLLVGLTIALIRRRKKLSVQTADFR